MRATAKRPKAANAPAPRGNLTIRVRDEAKRKAQARADARGRSLSEEIEALIEHADDRAQLVDQVFDLAYRDPRLVDLLLTMGEAMRDTLAAVGTGPEWSDDPGAFDQVAPAHTVIEGYRPEGEPPAPERPISDMTGYGVLTGTDDGDRIIPGEGVARFVMFRLAGNWSQPFPWLTAVRSRIGATIANRLQERSRGPKVIAAPAAALGRNRKSD
jgi:hypothetical protein